MGMLEGKIAAGMIRLVAWTRRVLLAPFAVTVRAGYKNKSGIHAVLPINVV